METPELAVSGLEKPELPISGSAARLYDLWHFFSIIALVLLSYIVLFFFNCIKCRV
jgi:hypothetical protein